MSAELPDTVLLVKRSIVGVGMVSRAAQSPARLSGTGFIVGDGVHVATNAHVVDDRGDASGGTAGDLYLAVFVGRESRTKARRARVMQVDQAHDLALLRISGSPLPALRLGRSSQVREGALYAFTGFPIGTVLGMYPATHRGIVAAISPIAIPADSSRSLDAQTIRRLRSPFKVFQLDATAYPGNSGSPLYEPANGRVVGILNSVFVKQSRERVLDRPSGISYAIPVDHLRALMREAGVSP